MQTRKNGSRCPGFSSILVELPPRCAGCVTISRLRSSFHVERSTFGRFGGFRSGNRTGTIITVTVIVSGLLGAGVNRSRWLVGIAGGGNVGYVHGLISLLRFAVNFYKYNIGCGGDNLSDFAVIRWLISPNG